MGLGYLLHYGHDGGVLIPDITPGHEKAYIITLSQPYTLLPVVYTALGMCDGMACHNPLRPRGRRPAKSVLKSLKSSSTLRMFSFLL